MRAEEANCSVQITAAALRRPLPSAPLLDGCSAPSLREEQAQPLPANEAELDHPSASMSTPSVPEADLIQKLSCLEAKIVILQEQLAQLALALLQERERTVEHRIAALESLIPPLVGRHLLPDPQEQGAGQESACASRRARRLLPAEQ